MTTPTIPYSRWASLTVTEVGQRFAGAPFTWGLAGGYAIEQFVGHPIRAHGDIDIVVFRDEQLVLQRWLSGAQNAEWRAQSKSLETALPWSKFRSTVCLLRSAFPYRPEVL